jgi:NAD(P)-dependent dehydrogenase (short-subunit alcohol dehydrogenase family)
VALALARYGAKVAVTARSRTEIGQVADEIRAASGEALAIAGDVAQYTDVQHVVHAATTHFGAIDMLVTSAGIVGPLNRLEATDPEQWMQTIQVNLMGTYYFMREVLPGMRERGYGRILNVGSGAAKRAGMWRAGAYSTSKLGLEMLTKSAAAEYEGTGVCIMNVRPGPVDTAMQVDLRTAPPEIAGQTQERFQKLHEEGKLTDPLHVGELLVAILMTEATGEIWDVREMPAELAAILEKAAITD